MEAMVPAFLAPILSGRGLDVYQAVVPMATANESETVTFSVGFLASPSTPGFWPVRAGEPWMKTVGWMGFVPVTDPESRGLRSSFWVWANACILRQTTESATFLF
jgi:hypothetical protein